jgi:membrane protein
MKFKNLGGMLKETCSDFMQDRALRLSAALAYYAIFSLGPLLLVVVGIAGLFFDEATIQGMSRQQLTDLMGAQAAETIETMAASRKEGTSILSTVLGVIGLLVGASGVFGQLQDSLNTIWEVKPKPGGGIWQFIRNRFLSLTMVLGTGFLLLISLALTTFVSAFADYMGSSANFPEGLIHTLNAVLSFGVIALLFAMIFKFLPDVEVQWRDVLLGAVGTALLFVLGKYLLGLYLGKESTTSTFGAASSVVVILMYVYYSSLILFFGAEFTQVYAKERGAKIVPSENAVPVTEDERAQQGITNTQHPESTGKKRRAAEVQRDKDEFVASNPMARRGERVLIKPLKTMGLAFLTVLAANFLIKSKTARGVLKTYSLLRSAGFFRRKRGAA